MALEVSQTSFFNHSTYSNSYYAALLPLEFFLSQVLVKGEGNRVIWASADIAYRRRFELVGKENKDLSSEILPQQLNLPFVSYSPSGGFWTPDDRFAAIQAKQLVRGIWEPGFPARMRAMPVKCSFTAIAHFDRDDDARLAYEMMLWEQVPKGPVQFATTVEWKGIKLPIPVFMTIDSIEFFPAYNEAEWLKKQKIIPIECKITVRTYILHFPDQAITPAREWTPYSTGKLYNDELIITESVILNFAASKGFGEFDFTAEISDPTTNQPDPFTPIEDDSNIADPQEITKDIISSYFSPADDIINPVVAVDPTSISTTSATLTWDVDPTSIQNVFLIKFAIPGHPTQYIDDPTIKSLPLSGLFPNSTYDISVLFYNKTGKVKLFKISITTLEDSTMPTPTTRRIGKLKGMTW